MALAGIAGRPAMLLVEDASRAAELDFHGSPTVTVNGRDVDEREWVEGAGAWG